MRNKLYTIMLSVILTLFSATAAFAESVVSVSPKSPPPNEEITVSGTVPYINITGNDAATITFRNTVNDRISRAVSQKIAEAVKSGVNAAFSYDMEADGGRIGVLVYSATPTSNGTKNEVSSINFDKNRLRFIKINDVLGVNGTKMANNFINNMIKKQPSKYNMSFSGIDENQDFYTQNGDLCLLFGSYALTKGYNEIETVKIPIKNVHSYKVSADDAPVNNLAVLLPLREISSEFGYTLTWANAADFTISLERGTFSTQIKISENSYKKGNTDIKLECAPIIFKDTAYVPITFFDEILGLSYYVSADGSVTISELQN
ncbi:hypothetical protein AGMMS49975_08740 [Clostridia bacterium]|nr:hypothetical protein AGMMS49975_08740 [Clostridia bacterium]